MKIIPNKTLLVENQRLLAGVEVELSDAAAAHLIAEGVADEAPADVIEAPETAAAAEAPADVIEAPETAAAAEAPADVIEAPETAAAAEAPAPKKGK